MKAEDIRFLANRALWRYNRSMDRNNTWKIAIIVLLLLSVLGVFVMKKSPSSLGLAEIQKAIDESKGSINADTFSPEYVASLGKPAIFVFGESWCQPCLSMIPSLEELSREQSDVVIEYVDLEKVPEALSYIPISATPTIAYYLEGGKPYMPSDLIPVDFIQYADRETGEAVLTLSIGAIGKDMLSMIIEDLSDAR